MINDKNLKLESGNDCSNYQVAGNLIKGVTYTEAKDIALTVFKANFHELSQQASTIALGRVEQFIKESMGRLQSKQIAPESFAHDPDFQCSFLEAQKAYARSGDENQKNILLNLVSQRAQIAERNIKQIVVNEAIVTVSKLTKEHLSVLAVAFLFRYSLFAKVLNINDLGQRILKLLPQFISQLNKNNIVYQHLEFAGCGAIQIIENKLEADLRSNYPHLFHEGFTNVDAGELLALYPDLFINCLNGNGNLQIKANAATELDKLFISMKVSEVEQKKILQLLTHNPMSESKINELVISVAPCMRELFDIWRTSSLSRFTLTSIGIAIGHSLILSIDPNWGDLSIWLEQ